ncbi:MarR family winged helix-turn-helix transcriptional regulator [Bradyrhizobium sp. AZCC 2230]|uniref:MarR family winged helix-turn-helix transcriptional regulator n=1 Tax=Bradyrhizobium sp. AZCC 2230 TaxID=3117021 RepID=UPI002FF28A9E
MRPLRAYIRGVAFDGNEKDKEILAVNKPLGIDQCNCSAMRKANRRISRFYDAHLEPTGLRITQFLTLAALNELGSAAVNALAEQLDIERTAMGKMVGFLERDGLVRIRPSPTDGRSRLIELTDAGRRLHDKAAPLWQEAQREFEQLNGEKNVAALRGALRDMVVGDMKPGSSED